MLGSLLKATVGTVINVPVSLVADVVTLGGTLSDRRTPYTATAVSDVLKNLENSVAPENTRR